MRSAMVISGTLLLLAVAGCGDDGDSEDTKSAPGPVTTVGGSVNIVSDCGRNPVAGTDDSSVTAEGGVLCEEALNVAASIPDADCDFSVEPECAVIGYTCIRASEEDAEVVVFECTKGDARVTIESPHVE